MNFTCPYCNQITTITSPNLSDFSIRIQTQQSKFEYIHLGHRAIACPNQACKELYLEVRLSKEHETRTTEGMLIQSWNLLPASLAKPQPSYIPEAIKADYYEACAILKLSPKASATLSRRCLQGIVRDYWDIPAGNRGKLGAELSFVKDQINADTWDGIQTIRSVGDIGAHMEKNVNYVVDVEIEESELLIELIEMLFEEWYVVREKRKQRSEKAIALSKTKLAQKKQAKENSKAQAENNDP